MRWSRVDLGTDEAASGPFVMSYVANVDVQTQKVVQGKEEKSRFLSRLVALSPSSDSLQKV